MESGDNMASFGEGFGNAFASTYGAVSAAQERKLAREQSEREFRLRLDEYNRRIAKEDAEATAYKSTVGRVGQSALTGNLQTDTGIGAQQAQLLNTNSGDTSFDVEDRMRTADVLRENAAYQTRPDVQARLASSDDVRPAGLPAADAEKAAKTFNPDLGTMTEEKAQEALPTKLAAAGLGKEAMNAKLTNLGIQKEKLGIEKTGLEVDESKRNANISKRFDSLMGDLQKESATRLTDITTTAQTEGMTGLVKKFGPEIKKAMGHDIALVGNIIVVKDKSGKVIQKLETTADAVQALQNVAGEEFTKKLESKMLTNGLFKTPQELTTYIKERRVEERAATKFPLELNELTAKANQLNADATYRRAAAKSMNEKTGNWTVVGTDTDGQPISYDKNTGHFGRPDSKPIADVSIFKKITGEKTKPEINPEMLKAAYKELSEAGTNSKAVAEVKAKWPDVFGEDPLVTAFKKAKQNPVPEIYNASAIPAPAPAPAPAPIKSNTYGNISPNLVNESKAALTDLDDQIMLARQQAQAAAKSGDRESIIRYGNIVNALEDKRNQAANSPFLR